MQEENTERTFQLELEQPELLKVLSMAAWDEKTVSELHTCYSAAEPATVRDCSALEATGTLEGNLVFLFCSPRSEEAIVDLRPL